MTKLMFVNVFLFQWFFVRLTKHTEKETGKAEGYGVRTKTRWSLQGFVLPCTGWWSKFVFIGKRKFFYLTKST